MGSVDSSRQIKHLRFSVRTLLEEAVSEKKRKKYFSNNTTKCNKLCENKYNTKFILINVSKISANCLIQRSQFDM
ncbi:hypothetical protein, partial [Flavonifractor plautii]|uniref:hypothetical protein n=1 Tax=Flavonifractor plautii TaxID=292800 RepID=UPI003D7D9E1E